MKRSPQYYALLISVGLFLLAILFSFKTHAQYVGIGGGNKGVTFNAGILADGIQIEASYRTPFLSNEKPTVMSLTIGREILLSNYEEDNFSVTPFIGGASLKYKDFSEYNYPPYKIISISEIKPMYGIELGKDWHVGRLFVSANHCGSISYTVGIKTFLNRL